MIPLSLPKYATYIGIFCLAASILLDLFLNKNAEIDFQVGMLMGLSIPFILIGWFFSPSNKQAKFRKFLVFLKKEQSQPYPAVTTGSFSNRRKSSNYPNVRIEKARAERKNIIPPKHSGEKGTGGPVSA